jgi:uncharacterized protein YprB with RNaseH-like and TPR domain
VLTFADRLRGIIGAGVPPAPVVPPAAPAGPTPDLASLGGEWVGGPGRSCFVVRRTSAAGVRHGRDAVGRVAERLERHASEAALLANGAPPRLPLLFFDLETTGLNGGAGTYAFLVGCGWFEDGAFATHQFLLTRVADERPMLEAVAAELSRAGAIVTFNGKSFDAPMLETRYLFHRLAWAGGEMPHLDVLHPARRFWRTTASADEGCSLGALETAVLGARRRGDVPGHEIPERYFRFVRSGDWRPLEAVLEHNRLDLLSLAGLTARLLELVHAGADAATTGREALALGHVYARAGFDARARGAWQRALALCRAPSGAFEAVKVDALRALARSWRRGRAFDEAAACWHRLLDIRGCPPPVVREATEALAIHHEHRIHDLLSARRYAVRTLEEGSRPAQAESARHRLARLDWKLHSQKIEVGSQPAGHGTHRREPLPTFDF